MRESPIIHVKDVLLNRNLQFGITALMIACYTSRLPIVRILLKVPNIDYNHQGKVMHTHVLIKGIWFKDPYLTQIGWSALLGACTNSNLEVVQVLLRIPNIDVNLADDVSKHVYPMLQGSITCHHSAGRIHWTHMGRKKQSRADSEAIASTSRHKCPCTNQCKCIHVYAHAYQRPSVRKLIFSLALPHTRWRN